MNFVLARPIKTATPVSIRVPAIERIFLLFIKIKFNCFTYSFRGFRFPLTHQLTAMDMPLRSMIAIHKLNLLTNGFGVVAKLHNEHADRRI